MTRGIVPRTAGASHSRGAPVRVAKKGPLFGKETSPPLPPSFDEDEADEEMFRMLGGEACEYEPDEDEEMMAEEMLRQKEANARAAMQGRPVTPPRAVEPGRSPGPRRTPNVVYKEALT